MKIDVNLDATLFDGDHFDGENSVESQVIQQAARKLTESVEKEATDLIRDEVVAATKERVGELFDGIIDDSVRKTNEWGEPIGNPTTMREQIVKEAQNWLTEQVDSNGKPSRYHRDNVRPRIEYIAHKVAREVMEEVMKEEIAELRKLATAQVSELRDVLQELLKR